MTTGAVILAFNNEETDYVGMAAWSARNIRRHLGIPTSIITDCQDAGRLADFDIVISADAQTGGTRYFEDYDRTVSWHNAGRTDVYRLTPYNQTLVLDADYVVASGDLKHVLNSAQDFMCHRVAWDMTAGHTLDRLNHFGDYNMPMWWATVMMFRKSNTAQYIFDCMQMIKQNWQHYRDLYNIRHSNYRNDFALSIAIGIVSGHTLSVAEIPGPLLSLMPAVTLTSQEWADHYSVEYTDSNNKLKTLGFAGVDFHAMGKKHLGAIIASTS
jgi:hypothetical protein